MLEQADPSLLELVDHVLNKGVVLSGEVTLGLAGIDLIYVRLLALICAADRVSGGAPATATEATTESGNLIGAAQLSDLSSSLRT